MDKEKLHRGSLEHAYADPKETNTLFMNSYI